MADISMCMTKKCPSFTKCYRAQAKAGERQSYMDFKPKGEQCADFIPFKNKGPS